MEKVNINCPKHPVTYLEHLNVHLHPCKNSQKSATMDAATTDAATMDAVFASLQKQSIVFYSSIHSFIYFPQYQSSTRVTM